MDRLRICKCMKCFGNETLVSKRTVERHCMIYGEYKRLSRVIVEEDGSTKSSQHDGRIYLCTENKHSCLKTNLCNIGKNTVHAYTHFFIRN